MEPESLTFEQACEQARQSAKKWPEGTEETVEATLQHEQQITLVEIAIDRAQQMIAADPTELDEFFLEYPHDLG